MTKYTILVFNPAAGSHTVTDSAKVAKATMDRRNAETAILVMGKAQFTLTYAEVERLAA